MTDRCPQCNAEYGPDDAYCPVCGTPRRGSAARGEATESDAAATWPGRPASAGAESEPNEEDDFIPLVFPPEPRGSWATVGGRRSLAAIATGLVVLGLLAAGAWIVIANGGNDDGDALDRPDVPAWVAESSPGVATPARADGVVATPASNDVAHDNTATVTLSPPMLSPPDGGSRAPSAGLSTPVEPGLASTGVGASPTAGSPSNASFAATPATGATASLSPSTPPTAAATPTPTATPSPTVTPTATATPSPTASPTAIATAAATSTPSPTDAPTTTTADPSIPASVFPNTVAAVLESIVAGIEPPAAEAAPTAPAPATTSPVPAGDGTGGAPPT